MFKTPSRVHRSSLSSAGLVIDGDDKENTQAGAGAGAGAGLGVVGGEKQREDGLNENDDGCGNGVVEKKQLSGQKRGGGGVEIEKQKSFTGSYFQVRLLRLAGCNSCIRVLLRIIFCYLLLYLKCGLPGISIAYHSASVFGVC